MFALKIVLLVGIVLVVVVPIGLFVSARLGGSARHEELTPSAGRAALGGSFVMIVGASVVWWLLFG